MTGAQAAAVIPGMFWVVQIMFVWLLAGMGEMELGEGKRKRLAMFLWWNVPFLPLILYVVMKVIDKD